jgi:hypothetical protein
VALGILGVVAIMSASSSCDGEDTGGTSAGIGWAGVVAHDGTGRTAQNQDQGHSQGKALAEAYDFTKSTKENHLAKGAAAARPFTGPYGSVRQSMDTAYHGRYTPEREAAQDEILHREYSTVGVGLHGVSVRCG